MNLQARLAALFVAGFLLLCAVGMLTPSARPHWAPERAVTTQPHEHLAMR